MAGLQKSLAKTLTGFCALALLFFIHRLHNFSILIGQQSPSFWQSSQFFFVGYLSDIWLAALHAVVIFLLSISLGSLARIGPTVITAGYVLVQSLLAALHTNYIEFFQHPILAFHVGYLLDPNFLKTNEWGMLSLASWTEIIFGFLIAAGLVVKKPFSSWGVPRLFGTNAVLLALALLAHNRNIHWREQWFVPTNLRVNGLEHLYLSAKHLRQIEFTKENLEVLADHLGLESPKVHDILWRREHLRLTEEEAIIRGAFQDAVANESKPMIIVTVMESFRPADTGRLSSGKTLTPHFDRLSAEGIQFLNAYATGNVTRAAQEAILCGYRSSVGTALMRERVDIKVKCLPNIPSNASTFWLHGGDGGFDAQESFWRAQGIAPENIMTRSSFPATVPQTGWGIGDFTFLRMAVDKLTRLRAHLPENGWGLGMLLTVSHHIPWDLPEDGQEVECPASEVTRHPSYRTACYSDFALGQLVAGLKANKLWDSTLLVVASDHGNLIPPAKTLYRDHEHFRLQTHVNLLLSGGLVRSIAPLRVEHPVSLVDVSATLAGVIGTEDFYGMGEPLLRHPRTLPIIVDRGDAIFNVSTGEVYQAEQIQNTSARSEEDLIALSYIRTYLAWLSGAK